ncbi:carboxylic acid transporter [Mycena floridula]|nr:carboxylic acid transporter [Mycena floridula]
MAPYFLQNLVPKREARQNARPLLAVLATLTWIQWAHFLSGWLAWTCDAIDFFSVSLSVKNLGAQFHKDDSQITTAITLTLLFRPVGALLFGIFSDRFGRKWPLVANLVLVAVLQLGAGFVQTFRQFLALRSLFGIGMGGIWGILIIVSASTALENLPVEARGLGSGILQQGYAVGYLIAAVINLFLVPETSAGWRSLFFCASGISLFAAIIRALLPESEVFLRAKALAEMLKKHWLRCIYAVLLMTGMSIHSSLTTKNFSPHNATVATIIGNLVRAIAGWMSQYIGRRLTIVIMVVLLACFIPLWILPSTFSALSAGAFCIQFGVQGAWGVIPILLAEMSPPAFRATFPGVAYQLGNMVSSASAQIEAVGGRHQKTTIIKNGVPTVVPDYAKVQGILIGVVAAFVIFITIIGPENHGAHFEKHKAAFVEGAADDDAPREEGSIDEKRGIEEQREKV